MAKLPRFTLRYDHKTEKWVLKKEATGQVVKTFASKAAATKGGVLERSIGTRGSVRIKKRDGTIQEERCYAAPSKKGSGTSSTGPHKR
jgi:hypothetical protein